MLTRSLKSAVDRASELPAETQDRLAGLMLEEIESARVWDEKLDQTGDQLAELARRALKRDGDGKSIAKGWIS